MIRKADVIEQLNARDEAWNRDFTSAIDKALPAFDGTQPLAFNVPFSMSAKALDMIIAAYTKEGGWTVHHSTGSDPRDGESWSRLIFS